MTAARPPDEENPPSPDELAEAEALRAYVAGVAASPDRELGATVGLLREARGESPSRLPFHVRRMGERRAMRRVVAPGFFAAAAVMLYFLWPQRLELPPPPGPELHAAAIAALNAGGPIGARLEALHALAGPARVRLVAELQQPAAVAAQALAAAAVVRQ